MTTKEREEKRKEKAVTILTDDQIKHMRDRFLGWKLPEGFSPDAGITFKPMFNEHMAHPMRHEPSGTNLFDATQAEEMIRYMIDGLQQSPDEVVMKRVDVENIINKLKWYAGTGESGKFKIVDADGTLVVDFVLFADRAKDCLSILENALGEKK